MSGPLSVTLADINMIHKKTDVWWSIFYKRYVDAIYNRRQENTVDKSYDGLSNYHPKVKLTVETNLLRSLDTEIIHNNGMTETQVHKKKTKLSTLWTSNIPKRYKRNTIKDEIISSKAHFIKLYK